MRKLRRQIDMTLFQHRGDPVAGAGEGEVLGVVAAALQQALALVPRLAAAPLLMDSVARNTADFAHLARCDMFTVNCHHEDPVQCLQEASVGQGSDGCVEDTGGDAASACLHAELSETRGEDGTMETESSFKTAIDGGGN